jgi:hypothetical protein
MMMRTMRRTMRCIAMSSTHNPGAGCWAVLAALVWASVGFALFAGIDDALRDNDVHAAIVLGLAAALAWGVALLAALAPMKSAG